MVLYLSRPSSAAGSTCTEPDYKFNGAKSTGGLRQEDAFEVQQVVYNSSALAFDRFARLQLGRAGIVSIIKILNTELLSELIHSGSVSFHLKSPFV